METKLAVRVSYGWLIEGDTAIYDDRTCEVFDIDEQRGCVGVFFGDGDTLYVNPNSLRVDE